MGDSGSTTLLNSPSKLALSSLLPRREGPWDFPGSGPVVKTVSNAGGVGSIPGQGTKIPSAMWWCGQKKKKKERDQQNRCVWLDSEGLGQFTYYVYGTMDSFSGWGTWNSHRQDTMSACSIAYVTNTY